VLQVADSGRRLLSADDGGSEWREYTPYQCPDGYDDDEAVEDYYMSSAAGRARVVFGNRRWGNSGYVAAGRQVARPSPQPRGKVRSNPRSQASIAARASFPVVVSCLASICMLPAPSWELDAGRDSDVSVV
jgi:hypothetical protein